MSITNVTSLPNRLPTPESSLAPLSARDRDGLLVQHRRLKLELRQMLSYMEHVGVLSDALRARAVGAAEALAEAVLQAPDA